MMLVPNILENVSILCDILSSHAEKCDIFSLEESTLDVTFDDIGKITLQVSNFENGNNGHLNLNIAQRCAISCPDCVQ